MNRRSFITFLGGAATWPLKARAQAVGDAGHCAALVAIDRTAGRDPSDEWSRLSECATL